MKGLVSTIVIRPHFAGAGLSAPSGLETASELAEHVVKQGFKPVGVTELEDLAERSCKFEKGIGSEVSACEPCDPSFGHFIGLLPDWSAKYPNEAQLYLARLAKEKCIPYILTINWDDLIQHALIAVGQPHQVFEHTDDPRPSTTSTSTVVYRLNGTVSSPKSMVACRQQLENFNWAKEWSKDVFKEAVRNRAIIFIGYSGSMKSVTQTVEHMRNVGGFRSAFVIDKQDLPSSTDDEWRQKFVASIGVEASCYMKGDVVSILEDIFVEVHSHLCNLLFTDCQKRLQEYVRIYGWSHDWSGDSQTDQLKEWFLNIEWRQSQKLLRLVFAPESFDPASASPSYYFQIRGREKELIDILYLKALIAHGSAIEVKSLGEFSELLRVKFDDIGISPWLLVLQCGEMPKVLAQHALLKCLKDSAPIANRLLLEEPAICIVRGTGPLDTDLKLTQITGRGDSFIRTTPVPKIKWIDANDLEKSIQDDYVKLQTKLCDHLKEALIS